MKRGYGIWYLHGLLKCFNIIVYHINQNIISTSYYGTWMLPGDLFENEKNSWPNKFENLMLWNYNHTHTLSKDYTCDI